MSEQKNKDLGMTRSTPKGPRIQRKASCFHAKQFILGPQYLAGWTNPEPILWSTPPYTPRGRI